MANRPAHEQQKFAYAYGLSVIQLDSTFSSCQGLQELFQPLSPDLVALQMSRGPLQGRLRVFQLGAIRFNLLETNQSLFLSGTRRPKPCTVAIPLDEPQPSSPYRAQGIPVEWPALMGYNRQLTDFDLRLPAGARLATIVIGKEVLLEQLDRRGGSQRTLERWESSNQLELLPELQQRLRDQLNQLWAKHTGQPIDQIKNDTERDYFMAPQEAKDYGIIDEVITHKKAADEDK